MATVTLEQLWIHRNADRDTFVKLDVAVLRVQSAHDRAHVRMASGTVRTFGPSTPTERMQWIAPDVSRTDIDTLSGWDADGDLLMIRDPRGRVVWGQLDGLDVSEPEGADEGFIEARGTFTLVTSTDGTV